MHRPFIPALYHVRLLQGLDTAGLCRRTRSTRDGAAPPGPWCESPLGRFKGESTSQGG